MEQSFAQTRAVLTVEKLFSRALVVGASVSAGLGTDSPGKRLGLKYGGPASVRTVARGGAPATEMIPKLTPEVLRDRSAIVGIDLFFWDSVQPSAAPSIQALDRLFDLSQEMNLPLILGDIPELLPGRQPARAALNRALHERCVPSTGCVLVRLDELKRQILREGIRFHGHAYSLLDFVPDGLHLSRVASEYLADAIAEAIVTSKPLAP